MLLLTNTRTTGMDPGAPPQEPASSFAEWRRASKPSALLMNAPAAPPEPVSLHVPWTAHNEVVAPSIEKHDYLEKHNYASPLGGLERSPAIRMLEQTIVCLHEMDRLGNLTIGQKIELSDLISRHRLILHQPRLESVASARAASGAAVAAS